MRTPDTVRNKIEHPAMRVPACAGSRLPIFWRVTMTDMRAVGFTEFGDPSVLRVVTVPRPSPGPGQVLVRVAAATVNPTDLGFRHGGRPLPPGVEPPYIPGMDLAGVIEEAGPSVT